MSTHESDASAAMWNTLWAGLRHEWLKLETLQYYAADETPSYSAWLDGRREESMRLLSADYEQWDAQAQEKLAHGVQLCRLRVVTEPFTPYVEWELAAFKRFSIPQGEQIFVVTSGEIADLTLPQGDLQRFDGELYFCAYDERAQWRSMTRVTGNEAADYQRLLEQLFIRARRLGSE